MLRKRRLFRSTPQTSTTWPNGVSAHGATMPCTLEGRAPLLCHSFTAIYWQQNRTAQQPECLSMHWRGASHIFMGIPLKQACLRLSLFHIPASSHAVHSSRCFNFTLRCSGISSSSQSLWWPHYNLHSGFSIQVLFSFYTVNAFAPRTSHLLIMLIPVSPPYCLYNFLFPFSPSHL